MDKLTNRQVWINEWTDKKTNINHSNDQLKIQWIYERMNKWQNKLISIKEHRNWQIN